MNETLWTGETARQMCVETGTPVATRADVDVWVLYCPPEGIVRGGYLHEDEEVIRPIVDRIAQRNGWEAPVMVSEMLSGSGAPKTRGNRKKAAREEFLDECRE